jgi:hypothetical protein
MDTFEEKFCAEYGVARERYEDAVFWRCLHRPAWVFAAVLRMVSSEYFAADYDLIRGVGRLRTAERLGDELDNFYSHLGNHGFFRRRLRMRISVRRLITIVHVLLPGQSTPARNFDSRPPM